MTPAVETAPAGVPYKGLTYFTEADAAFFFGREAERDLIIADLKASVLSLVYGPSGVGKSSLLRAGVAATLRAKAREDMRRFGSAEFVPVVFANWRDDPLDGLVRAVAAAASEFAVTALSVPAGAGLVEAVEAAAKATQGSLLVILDQFEEYFLYHRNEVGPHAFSEQFVYAVNHPGLPAGFLVAMRDDALAQLDAFRGRIPKLFSSYRRINPLSKAAAREAIVRPLDEHNLVCQPGEQVAIEDGLVGAVVEQVGSGQVKLDSVGAGGLDGAGPDTVEAPYLQLVMSRLWQEETSVGSRTLRLSTLEALGGAQRIVRSHLDSTLGAMAAADQEIAADVFHHLVTPSGTKIAHAVSDLVDYTSWPEEKVAAVLERLGEGDTRIVRPVQPPAGHDGPPRYEIFHDVLAPAVLDWRGRHEKEAAQREKQAAQHRASVQRRRSVVATVVALLAIAALTTFIVRNATLEEDANRSRVLAADAASNLSGDPQLSTLLALSAIQVSPTKEAQAVLREAYPEVQEIRSLAWGSEISATAFSPDAKLVAAAATNHAVVRIWDSEHGGRPVDLPTVFSSVSDLAFSPDGRLLAVVGAVPGGRQWRHGHWPGVEVIGTSKGTRPKVLFVPNADDFGQWGYGVAWAGPGSVITADGNGYLCEYSLAVSAARHCRSSGFNSLSTFSIDKAGTVAAVTGEYNGSELAALYSVPAFHLLHLAGRYIWGLGNTNDAVLSESGEELATTSVQGITMVYDIKTGAVIAKFATSGQFVSADFSPDGSELATTTDLGGTTIWRLAPQAELGAVEVARLNCDCGVVYSTQFDPTGAPRLVTGSADGVVRVWDTLPRGLLATYQVSQSFPFVGYPDGISDLAFVPGLDDVVALISGPFVTGGSLQPDRAVVLDLRTGRWVPVLAGKRVVDMGSLGVSGLLGGGHALVVGIDDGESKPVLRGWVLTNVGGQPRLVAAALRRPRRWPGIGRGDYPQELALSPDGKWVVVEFIYPNGAEVNTLDVLDLDSGKAAVLARTPGYSYFVNHIAFDAASRHVVVAYNSGAAWTWDLPGSGAPRFSGAFRDPAHNGVLWDAEFSPNGHDLALADNFGNVTIFGTTTHRLVLPEPLNAGTGQVNTVVFGPDSTTVLTSGDDGTARVWDLRTGQQLESVGPMDEPSPSAVNSAVFGQLDGRTVVLFGGNDGTLRVWSSVAATPDLHDLEVLARQALGSRCYTPAELREFSSPAQVFRACRR